MLEQKSFIKNLSDLLDEKNITQRELAEKIGVTEVTISRYLSGERSPRIEIVNKIAEFFNVSIDYLLGISDDRETKSQNLYAFQGGYESLTEANKKVLDNVLKSLLESQKDEERE